MPVSSLRTKLTKHPSTRVPLPDAQAEPSYLGTMVILFVVLRLTLLILYTPEGLLNVYTDYKFYYQVAQFSEQGYIPYINMWFEYPPLLSYLPLGAYWLMRGVLPAGEIGSISYQIYARLLGSILLLFETGILVLLYQIARRCWGTQRANWVGWVYACLSLPLLYWNFGHQNVSVFFLLLAVYWFVEQKPMRSALALGLGVASKLTPLFLLAPVAKFLWPRWRSVLFYTGIVLAIFAASYLPFCLAGKGAWVMASFKATANVGSWSTVWALIDGNWSFGDYGPLSTRLSLAEAGITHANPARIPGVLLLFLFGLLYSLVFFRPVAGDDRGQGSLFGRQFIWFATLSALTFHLWLRGWSQQWGVLIIPLFLLSFPDRLGVGLSLLLTLCAFIAWPLYSVSGVKALAVLSILGRTALFITVCGLLVRRLWPARMETI